MAIDIIRGDIVICVVQGDYGKGRPALVVQSDLFNATHASLAICPITSHLVETPLFRILLSPSPENGLQINSQIMIDKITAVRREKIREKIGFITKSERQAVDQALKLWLNI
jgi:mRNA interferase MazF